MSRSRHHPIRDMMLTSQSPQGAAQTSADAVQPKGKLASLDRGLNAWASENSIFFSQDSFKTKRYAHLINALE